MKFSLLFNWFIYNNSMSKKILPIILLIIFSILFQNPNKSTNMGYIYPTYEHNISSYFGYRNIFGSRSFHNGIDFPVPQGTPVYSTQTGIVKYCSFIKGYGNSVIVQNIDGNTALYAHLEENYIVKVGQEVNQGEQIAIVGPKYLSNGILNGLTTGPHLHFTIYNNDGNAIDPLSLNLK